MKRSYLTAKEAEQVMQETRNQDGFTGKNEKILVNTMVKNAKANNRIGDKLLMVIDPKYIHIPEWQRNIRLEKAYAIGNNYDKYKWDAPKILLFEDKYLCIDGQHRIFGAFKAKKEDVVCEVMECTMEEAIELYLNQTTDRTKMQSKDIYHAALAAGKPEYVELERICHKNNVAVKGDEKSENTVGTLTSISDGISLIKTDPQLLDDILTLIGKLEWNGYADSYNGKAYTAKIIRVMKRLFAYCDGRHDQMEEALLARCKGTEFFVNNLIDRTQAQIFDFLSAVVKAYAETPFKEFPPTRESKTKRTAKKSKAM